MRDTNRIIPSILQERRELIESLMDQRKFDQAIRIFEESESELAGAEDRDSAMIISLIARAYATIPNLPRALKLARRAETELAKFGENCDLAQVYLTLGNILRDMGNIDEAVRSYHDAESIFRRSDNVTGQSQALNRLAQIAFMRSEMPQAITLLTQCVELARRENDTRRLAYLYGNLGRVQSFSGSSRRAIENLSLNIELSQGLEDHTEVARASLSLGYEYIRLERFSDAEREFNRAKVIIESESLEREHVQYLIYTGEMLRRREQLEEARETLENALRMAMEIVPDGDLTARARRALAEVALEEKRWQRALIQSEESERIFKRLGEKIDMGVLAKINAIANYQMSKIDESIAEFERSIDLLDSSHAVFELAEALEWAGHVSLFKEHKRLAYLFRAQDLQRKRDDIKSVERIQRYISRAPEFTLGYRETALAPATEFEQAEGGITEFVTANAKMQKILSQMSMIRTSELPILLTGETGVGKGYLAKRFHQFVCPDKPFVALNVTNVPETLLESELFGHRRGAFTDASNDSKGILEAANGGVLFLDEIGEMPLALQMRLLTVIEEKRFRPLGTNEEVSVDFILITATNCDLRAMVENREFRRDLYHRLDGFSYEIPPLRERKEDIPLLLNFYLERYGLIAHGESADGELVRSFLSQKWEGNVRELENTVKRMKALSSLVKEGSLVELVQSAFDNNAEVDRRGLNDRLSEMERELILEALLEASWNQSQAARILDIHEATLRSKMRRHGLSRPGTDDIHSPGVRTLD